ncbi:MAG: HEAT repeat domain-containing protein [Chloroflexota bacterium]
MNQLNYFVRFESLQEWAHRHPLIAPFLKMPRRQMETAVLSDDLFSQLANNTAHPNPRVRFEIAHLADHLDDVRSFEILVALCQDEVPRVRAEALHGLACERCKTCPLPVDAVALLVEAALHDSSEKVRSKMVVTFAEHSPDPRIEQALHHIVLHDESLALRQKAHRALRNYEN